MSEATGETAAPVELKKNVVGRVAERVGKFLSETYTIKGATAKELQKYADTYDRFTGDQRAEMLQYYEKVAQKSATWKVVRNWVATGAGLAVAGAAVAFGPAAYSAVMAGNLSGWFAAEAATFKGAISSPFIGDRIKNIWSWITHPAILK